MATTGIINGTLLLMYINEVAVGSANSHTLRISHTTRKATTKGASGWQRSLEGLRDWGASGGGFVAFDDTYGFDELMGLITNRTKVTLKLSSEVSGDSFYQGSAYLTNLQLEAPVEDNASYSFEFEGDGALTQYTQT